MGCPAPPYFSGAGSVHVSASRSRKSRSGEGEQRRWEVRGAVAWLAVALHAGAAAQALPALSFQAAQQQVLAHSDKLGAARAAVQSKELQLEGVRNLGAPRSACRPLISATKPTPISACPG